jgi:hypothetical protein
MCATMKLSLMLLSIWTMNIMAYEEVPVEYKLFKYDTKHYLFFSETLVSQNDAKSICASYNGVLASIWTDEQNTMFANRMTQLVSEAWHGRADVYSFWTPYIWSWQGYTKWLNKYSVNRQGGCVEVLLDRANNDDVFGYWNNVHCSSKRPFICQIDADEIPTVLETAFKKYMFFVQKPMTFDNAQQVCWSWGGDLVRIEDSNENTFVINAFNVAYDDWFPIPKNYFSGGFWIDTEVNNDQVTYTNGSLVKYSNFEQWAYYSMYDGAGVHARTWYTWAFANKQTPLNFVCQIVKPLNATDTNVTISDGNLTSTTSPNLPDLSYLDILVVQQNRTFNTTEHTVSLVTNITNNVSVVACKQRLHRKMTDVDVTTSDLLWVMVSVGVLVLVTFVALCVMIIVTCRRTS